LLIALNAVRIEKGRLLPRPFTLTLAFNTLTVPSIEQNGSSDSLPDFRSLGVVVRILLLGNIAGFVAALILSRDMIQFAAQCARLAVVLEPALLASLVSLYALSKWLARQPYAWGIGIVMLLSLCGRRSRSS
jgi:hypothetical protein